MDDRENALEELYVLWVEAQILHWVNEGSTEGLSGDCIATAGATREEAREGAAPWAPEEERPVNALRRRPTVLTVGDVARNVQGVGQLAEGPEPAQGANQLGDVARAGQLASELVGGSETGTGADPLGDGNSRPGFDPVQFWLMLFQAGYEPW